MLQSTKFKSPQSHISHSANLEYLLKISLMWAEVGSRHFYMLSQAFHQPAIRSTTPSPPTLQLFLARENQVACLWKHGNCGLGQTYHYNLFLFWLLMPSTARNTVQSQQGRGEAAASRAAIRTLASNCQNQWFEQSWLHPWCWPLSLGPLSPVGQLSPPAPKMKSAAEDITTTYKEHKHNNFC